MAEVITIQETIFDRPFRDGYAVYFDTPGNMEISDLGGFARSLIEKHTKAYKIFTAVNLSVGEQIVLLLKAGFRISNQFEMLWRRKDTEVGSGNVCKLEHRYFRAAIELLRRQFGYQGTATWQDGIQNMIGMKDNGEFYGYFDTPDSLKAVCFIAQMGDRTFRLEDVAAEPGNGYGTALLQGVTHYIPKGALVRLHCKGAGDDQLIGWYCSRFSDSYGFCAVTGRVEMEFRPKRD